MTDQELIDKLNQGFIAEDPVITNFCLSCDFDPQECYGLENSMHYLNVPSKYISWQGDGGGTHLVYLDGEQYVVVETTESPEFIVVGKTVEEFIQILAAVGSKFYYFVDDDGNFRNVEGCLSERDKDYEICKYIGIEMKDEQFVFDQLKKYKHVYDRLMRDFHV